MYVDAGDGHEALDVLLAPPAPERLPSELANYLRSVVDTEIGPGLQLKLAVVTEADELLTDAVWIDLPTGGSWSGDLEQQIIETVDSLWSHAETK